jgi:hypothetical protein
VTNKNLQTDSDRPLSIQCAAPPSHPGDVEVSIYVEGRRASTNELEIEVVSVCPSGSYSDALHLKQQQQSSSNTTAATAKTGGGCLNCPKGAVCAGGLMKPVSAAGWYPSPVKEAVFLECFGGTQSCKGNNQCEQGYKGPRCVYV